MKKLAIIGASYLQRPLVEKAKALGIQTHVFAWEEGNSVGDICDYFYPISIVEKELILAKCQEIGIDGIVSIASDIAMPTVNYVANALQLIGNSLAATLISTDKYEMRKALRKAGIATPRFEVFNTSNFIDHETLSFPVIVKPTDRSGSRGVQKVFQAEEVNAALEKALAESLAKSAIVEEFMSGQEYSVECISYAAEHYPLAITEKVTTGPPYFVELEHHQPASFDTEQREEIFREVTKGLHALGIENGASHTEIFVLQELGAFEIRIIEVAGRMGGDFIGSHLTPLSTGFDYVRATIDVSLGQFNFKDYSSPTARAFSGVYYLPPGISDREGIIARCSANADTVHCELLIEESKDKGVLDASNKRVGTIVYNSTQRRPRTYSWASIPKTPFD